MQILTYFFKLFFCGLTLKLMVLYIICIWKILRKGSGWAGAMCSDVLWIFLSFLFPRMILSCFSSQHNSLQNSILIVIFFFLSCNVSFESNIPCLTSKLSPIWPLFSYSHILPDNTYSEPSTNGSVSYNYI